MSSKINDDSLYTEIKNSISPEMVDKFPTPNAIVEKKPVDVDKVSKTIKRVLKSGGVIVDAFGEINKIMTGKDEEVVKTTEATTETVVTPKE